MTTQTNLRIKNTASEIQSIADKNKGACINTADCEVEVYNPLWAVYETPIFQNDTEWLGFHEAYFS
jgi:hypothetical protein